MRSLVDRGVAARLKPGLFVLVPYELGKETEYMGHPWLVAKALAGGENYYLSHGTAMAAHQMLTQPQLVVYVSTSTPKRTQSIKVPGRTITKRSAKPAVLQGRYGAQIMLLSRLSLLRGPGFYTRGGTAFRNHS